LYESSVLPLKNINFIDKSLQYGIYNSEKIRKQNEINMEIKIKKLTRSNIQLRTVANVLINEKEDLKIENENLSKELTNLKNSK
jgi:regulator of replication initiation timing